MSKTILITGAGSGLGEGAAIGLAKNGHTVIATAESWPQVTALRDKVAAMNLPNLTVTKLNMLDPYDVVHAAKLDFDVLVNNAGIAEGGPIAEIPMPLVRQNFEVNVFALLDLTQRVVRRWVRSQVKGKVVFISSIVGLVSPGMIGTYSATKHAVQSIAESMQDELKEFGIQVPSLPASMSAAWRRLIAGSMMKSTSRVVHRIRHKPTHCSTNRKCASILTT